MKINKNKIINMKFGYVIFFCFISISYIHAQDASQIQAFDKIINLFAIATGKWGNILTPIVLLIFWTISMLEFLWQVAVKKIFSGDIKKFWIFLMVRLIVTSLFASIFLYTSFYTSIVNYITKIGALLGGLDVSIKEGSSLSIDFSVSQIFGLLWDKYAVLVATLTGSSIGATVASKIPIIGSIAEPLANYLMWMAMAILAGIILICIPLILILVQAYIVIFGGIFLAGFSGSSWTFNYWQRYLSYVGGISIQLFTTCIILGIMIGSMTSSSIWSVFSYDNSSISAFAGSIIQSLVGTVGVIFVFVALIWTIPTQAKSMLNGTVEGGLGTVIGGVAGLASGGSFVQGMSQVAGGNVMKGISAAKNIPSAISNARQAGRSAMMSARHGSISGGKDASLSDTDWKNQLRDIGKNAAKSSLKTSMASATEKGNQSVSKGTNLTRSGSSSIQRHADRGMGGSAPNINANPHNHH